MFQAPHERVKTAFDQLKTEKLCGRDSFVKMLSIQSDLRLSGKNPDSDDVYLEWGTTRAQFMDTLRLNYRRAAQENYEGCTDVHFQGSGRATLEAISDLHLVPAYMKLGGLDLSKAEAWESLGFTKDDYDNLRAQRLMDEASRCHDLAHQDDRKPQAKIHTMDTVLFYFREAGFDPAAQDGYQRIKTTKAAFEDFVRQQEQLCGGRQNRPFPL